MFELIDVLSCIGLMVLGIIIGIKTYISLTQDDLEDLNEPP